MSVDNDLTSPEPPKFGRKVPEHMRLSGLKKKILIHVFFCGKKICNSNHIATTLGYNPSSVRQSVDELEQERYLKREQWKRTKKILLTTKGVAAAVVHTNSCKGSYSGVYNQLRDYQKAHSSEGLLSFDQFDHRMKGPDQKDYLTYVAMDLMLSDNLFDEDGNEKVSEEQKKKVISTLGYETVNKFGEANVGSKDFFDQYGVSKKFTEAILDAHEKEIMEARKRMSRTFNSEI